MAEILIIENSRRIKGRKEKNTVEE